MAKTSGNYLIPFDPNGNQLHYPGWRDNEWRENADFTDTLTFDDYRRGRSAAYFNLIRADGTSVTMFLKELTEAIPHMVCGKLCGRFRFIKRGQNYGVTLIEAAE